jgi:ubiquinone biosynthesis protein COQ9
MTASTSYAEARREKRAQRDAVLTAALPNVPFDGWTDATLDRAAEAAGFAGQARRIFPRGPKEAIAHFMDLADRLMLEDLKAHDLAGMKVRARITLGVRVRLERWTPHREAIRRALSLAPLPPFAGDALRGWYRTVDAIWRAAGDRATDFNFYTKRGLLAAVYGATVLYWLDDRSPGCSATWTFLDRRIADAMQIPQIKARLTERLKHLPNPVRMFERMRDVRSRRRPGAR